MYVTPMYILKCFQCLCHQGCSARIIYYMCIVHMYQVNVYIAANHRATILCTEV